MPALVAPVPTLVAHTRYPRHPPPPPEEEGEGDKGEDGLVVAEGSGSDESRAQEEPAQAAIGIVAPGGPHPNDGQQDDQALILDDTRETLEEAVEGQRPRRQRPHPNAQHRVP